MILVKFFAQPLLKLLKELQKYYELIVFTSLPKRFMIEILNKMPEIGALLNFVLTLEDASTMDEYYVKDISMLLHNRELGDVFVVEPEHHYVDSETVSCMHPEPYDGLIPYT